MYAVLAMLVIPAMLYGYDRAKPDGCRIDGQVWTYAYQVDAPEPTDAESTDVPTHAGLIVREGESFIAEAGNAGPRWPAGRHLTVMVQEGGRHEILPATDGGCAIDRPATDTGYWLVGEKVRTLPRDPLVDADWQYSIQGISPVAEQIGRTIWPLVGFILVTGLLSMAVREAVK